jgi:hypothetical protein
MVLYFMCKGKKGLGLNFRWVGQWWSEGRAWKHSSLDEDGSFRDDSQSMVSVISVSIIDVFIYT